jgi:hypothetical protein
VIVLCFLGLALIGSEPGPVLPQCSDGIDNDGDNRTDGNDYNCMYQLPSNPNDPIVYFEYCPNWDDESTQVTAQDCN